MFRTKKKKIQQYLDDRQLTGLSAPFDHLLRDYLHGELKQRLTDAGIKRAEIVIDWSDQYKCIGVQGKYERLFVDLQIEPEEFSLCVDPVEPDAHCVYPLNSAEQLYQTVREACNAGK